jgi:hypothetical protein
VQVKRGRVEPPAFSAAADDPAAPKPPRWTPPHWREVVVATLTAIFVAFTGSLTGAFSTRTEHVPDAYALTYQEGTDPSDPGQLVVNLRSTDAAVPREVQLYRNAEAAGPPITLAEGAASFVRIDTGLTPYVFQVRGALANGAFALSNALTAPGLPVLIDAFPWARVRILSVDGRVRPPLQTTPASLRLPEGQYELRLENDNTPELVRSITVTQGATNSFRFDMPDITLEQVLRQLVPPKATARD